DSISDSLACGSIGSSSFFPGFKKYQTKPATIARPQIPPTTAPAMVPAFDFAFSFFGFVEPFAVGGSNTSPSLGSFHVGFIAPAPLTTLGILYSGMLASQRFLQTSKRGL